MIAVVTGANRGLGLETALELARRNIHVVLGVRKPAENEKLLARFAGLSVELAMLDVADEESCQTFFKQFHKKHQSLDVLVNNAGVFDRSGTDQHGFDSEKAVRSTLETNLLGAYRMCQGALPLMKAQKRGRIVNVSSGMGQLSEMGTGSPAYRISKTALNGLTKWLAAELKDFPDILVNSVCPGWVKTDMGSAAAPRSIEEGAAGIVWAATLPKAGPSGGFFRDGKALSW